MPPTKVRGKRPSSVVAQPAKARRSRRVPDRLTRETLDGVARGGTWRGGWIPDLLTRLI
jgi:hypothetical protein